MAQVTPETKTKFADLWLAGVKAEAIAAEFGVSLECIKKNRVRMRLPPRICNGKLPLPLLSPPDETRAIGMWRNGRDTQAIANRLRVKEAQVYNSISNLREQLRRKASA